MRKKDIIIIENKKNVLVVSGGFPVNPKDFGARFIYDLSKRLTRDFNMIILAPYTKGVKKKEKWGNLTIYRFQYFWPARFQKVCYEDGILFNIEKNKFLIFVLPFLFISQFFKIIYLIKKEKIDLIHAHIFLPSGLTAGLVAKILKKPLIVTAHGSDILLLKGWFWKKVKKIIFNLADIVTVVSLEIAQELANIQNVKIEKISIIPMGVETSVFKLILEKKKENRIIKNISHPILFFVGRLNKAKGVNYLIKALPIIIEKFSEVSLMIVGSGSKKKELESLINNLGLKKRVFFLGNIPNQELPDYYQQADVFILPSLSEGIPISVLEAMSSGCPVVATKVGGLPYLIKDKLNGLLVNLCSSKEISQAIIKILSDDDLRNSFIKEARKTVEEKYDWEVIYNQFKDIYLRYL